MVIAKTALTLFTVYKLLTFKVLINYRRYMDSEKINIIGKVLILFLIIAFVWVTSLRL